MKCVFIGSDSKIGEDITLDKYGQTFELPDDLAHDAIQSAPFLPAAEFEAIGHTKEELTAFAYPGARTEAPEGFKAKLRAAHLTLAALRERVAAGGKLTTEDGDGK